MHNKLKEYRNKRSELKAEFSNKDFSNGFNAAIDLNLAVRFAHWCLYLDRIQNGDNLLKSSTSELFDYWLTNVWQPEK